MRTEERFVGRCVTVAELTPAGPPGEQNYHEVDVKITARSNDGYLACPVTFSEKRILEGKVVFHTGEDRDVKVVACYHNPALTVWNLSSKSSPETEPPTYFYVGLPWSYPNSKIVDGEYVPGVGSWLGEPPVVFTVFDTTEDSVSHRLDLTKMRTIQESDFRDRNGYCALHSGGEPEALHCRNPHDHCKHGVYVGGCGIDFMCGRCEMGDD